MTQLIYPLRKTHVFLPSGCCTVIVAPPSYCTITASSNPMIWCFGSTKRDVQLCFHHLLHLWQYLSLRCPLYWFDVGYSITIQIADYTLMIIYLLPRYLFCRSHCIAVGNHADSTLVFQSGLYLLWQMKVGVLQCRHRYVNLDASILCSVAQGCICGRSRHQF